MMVKEVTVFQCSVCGKLYRKKEWAEHCERCHPEELRLDTPEPGFPSFIVLAKGAESRTYKRLRKGEETKLKLERLKRLKE